MCGAYPAALLSSPPTLSTVLPRHRSQSSLHTKDCGNRPFVKIRSAQKEFVSCFVEPEPKLLISGKCPEIMNKVNTRLKKSLNSGFATARSVTRVDE